MKSYVSKYDIYIFDLITINVLCNLLKFVVHHYSLMTRGITSDDKTDLCGRSRITG